MKNNVEFKLSKSRSLLVGYLPFFGVLSLKLKLEEDTNIETAATNGETYYYNPDFIDKLKQSDVNWITIHEVLHAALGHIWRRENRHPQIWNIACDLAVHDLMHQYIQTINDIKIRSQFTMPQGGLYDKKYENQSVEQIYDDLIKKAKFLDISGAGGSGNSDGDGDDKNKQNGNQTSPDDLGLNGEVLDDHDKWNESQTQKNKSQKTEEWQGNLVSAAQMAEMKLRGDLPGCIKRIIQKILKPQKNWRMLLAEFVEQEINDYSFNPPDKRYSGSEFFLPDFNDEVDIVKNIYFWVDTSGSMGDKEISIAYSEIVGAIQQFEGKLSGSVGFFDSQAYEPKSFESVDDVLKIKPRGGGGTDFRKPFEYMKKHDLFEDCAGIIFYTDGYDTWPKESIAEGIPVLFLVTNEDRVPPWGQHTTLKI